MLVCTVCIQVTLVVVVSKIIVPQDIHVLIPTTCECAGLWSKGELRLLIRPQNREITPDHRSGPDAVRESLRCKRKAEDSVSQRREVRKT